MAHLPKGEARQMYSIKSDQLMNALHADRITGIETVSKSKI